VQFAQQHQQRQQDSLLTNALYYFIARMATPPPNADFANLSSTLKASLLSTTRTTTSLCAEDLSFHRSLTPSFATSLDTQNARLLALASRLLGNVGQGSEVVSAPPKLVDSDELAEQWRGVVDVVDSLLERADISLDEYTGLIRRGEMKGVAEVCETFLLFRSGCVWRQSIAIVGFFWGVQLIEKNEMGDNSTIWYWFAVMKKKMGHAQPDSLIERIRRNLDPLANSFPHRQRNQPLPAGFPNH
jgi:hypothetical protein